MNFLLPDGLRGLRNFLLPGLTGLGEFSST